MKPPPLKNDCFSLPPGVEWMPVDDALAHLRQVLRPVVATQTESIQTAAGRFLAQDVLAKRSNPPFANSAVDGYGFAGPALDGVHKLPLLEGRAAAGAPYRDTVPLGSALRILTGAFLPDGVDTVVLEEDTSSDASHVGFYGPIKAGANTRRAGEDVAAGDTLLDQGTHLRPQEIAILAATGVSDVLVHKRLNVGILSTGDELCAVGQRALDNQIYDANGPMLRGLLDRLGVHPVDLKQARDDRGKIRQALDRASQDVNAIVVSGGASAGDEDHVSALLNENGAMGLWRVAMKPGRPMAFGIWNGVPVFGLPGNPVAAFVCALVFVLPALRLLAGGRWTTPNGYMVPAAFEKTKKAGRREYLRARIDQNGQAEVFKSEGSGRISGLSWADGLVELSDGAGQIKKGDLVRYLPFLEFA